MPKFDPEVTRPVAAAALLASLLAPAAASAAEPCPDGDGPGAAVMRYLSAMHEERFADAWDTVTEAMTDGRDRETWAALQARAYRPGQVSIYRVDPRQPLATEADPECRAAAVVPNILSSRDRVNEHGLVEFEIYTVQRIGDAWRVAGQETLFDDDAIAHWFPNTRRFETRGAD